MSDAVAIFTILQRFKAANPMFAALDEPGLRLLSEAAMDVSFQPETAIIKQGQTAKTFYIIVRGRVRVVADGNEVARLGPGNFFGEMGVMNDEPRTASVIALEDVRCLAFDKAALMGALEAYPKVLHALAAVGVERAGKLADVQAGDFDIDH